MKSEINNLAGESIRKLEGWIDKNGWETYDPNDVKGHPLFVFLLRKKNIFAKAVLYLLYAFYMFNPVLLRRLFGVKPGITAGGMGFLAGAYIEMYRFSGDAKYLKKTEAVLRWLEENRIKEYDNFCWGFYFDWQSTMLIPKNTPIGYTTAECAKPFLEYFKITKDAKYLDIAVSASKFLINGLNKKDQASEGMSLSYTPLDEAEVINSNAIIASVIREAGMLAQIAEFIECSKRIVKFVFSEQLVNGSWYYYSSGYANGPSIIDNFHTAMILQSIEEIYSLERDPEERGKCASVFARGLVFYANNFFSVDGLPKITPGKKYPVDIASCAEAITLLSRESELKNELDSELLGMISQLNEKLIVWTINNMQSRDGAFAEKKYWRKKINVYSVRWGQAFMLRSLALALGCRNSK